MKVNTSKTNILCISDTTYTARAFIREPNGDKLESLPPPATIKILGFTFGSSPTVRPHVLTIRKKFRQRLWTLYNLKKHGFSEEELVKVYKTCFRPVADYLDVVYHAALTDDLDEELDRLQNRLSLIHI